MRPGPLPGRCEVHPGACTGTGPLIEYLRPSDNYLFIIGEIPKEDKTMGVRVGINGFGRIGRLVLKAGWGHKDIEWVAVNDLTDAQTLAHLYKYDSIFGIEKHKIEARENDLVIDGKAVKVTAQ